MKDNYDFSQAVRNPYIDRLPPRKKAKKQISINIDEETVDYFKSMAEDVGIPYQTLMNKYLSYCAAKRLKAEINWV